MECQPGKQTAFVRLLFCIATFLPLGASCLAAGVAQQTPISATQEYQSLLSELKGLGRPTRLALGSPIATSFKPVVREVRTAEILTLESARWAVHVHTKRWGVGVENKITGFIWKLDSLAFLPPVMEGGNDSTFAITEVQQVTRSAEGWQIIATFAGSPRRISIQLSVISPSILRLSIRPDALDQKRPLHLGFVGSGPFFGLGERFIHSKLDGVETTLLPEDLLGRPGHDWTYIPVPYLLTPHGLGLYLDTTARTSFDLSQAEQQRFRVATDMARLDLYLFVGNSPKEVLSDYTLLTGRPPLPPPWAFGVWICAYQGPERVLKEAHRLKEEKIPASAIWVFDVMGRGDIMGWPLWWTGYYANPHDLTHRLHELGFKVLTYVHPYVRSVLAPYSVPNPSFAEGLQHHFFVFDPKGRTAGPAFEPYKTGNIDFTNPEAADWWQARIQDILLKDDFDGWMEDFGEWVSDNDRFAIGKPGRELANAYPLVYHKLTHQIAHEIKPDSVQFVRSGYAGSQAYSTVIWGGDQFPDWTSDHGLPSVVAAGITAGLSGFSTWGPDIEENGYSKELWMRWVEFGALTPVMRNHPWDKPPLAINLWSDSQTTDVFRRYAELHTSLFPYFYSYAEQATKTGLPIIRHLLLEFPEDQKTYELDDEYLLGEKILVAPVVTQGATQRAVYLPRGSWINYWTDELVQGNREVTVSAPLEQIPIFVRAGSILPFIDPKTETLAADLTGPAYPTPTGPLRWRVYPDAVPTGDRFTLYDGTATAISSDGSHIDVQVGDAPVPRHNEFVFVNVNKPLLVKVGTKALSEIDTSIGQSGNRDGWWVDPTDGALHVAIFGTNFSFEISKLNSR